MEALDQVLAATRAGTLPDLAILLRRFAPRQDSIPDVTVTLPSAALYDALLLPDPGEIALAGPLLAGAAS